MEEFNDIVFLIERSRFELAIVKLNERLPQHIDNERIYLLLGICHTNLKEYQKAETAIKKALQINPESPEVLIQYAILEIKKGNHFQANKYLDNVIRINPEEEEVFLLKSTIDLLKNDLENAAKYAKLELANHPSSNEAKNIIALELFVKGKNSEAEEIVKQVLHDDSHDTFALTNLALIKLNNNKVKESTDLLKDLIAKNPTDERIIHVLKIAISSRNIFFHYVFKFIFYIEGNPKIFKLTIAILYRLLIIITAYIYIVKDTINLPLFTIALLSIHTIIILPLKTAPQLSNLFLLQNPLGKLLLNKRDIILSILSFLAFISGMFFFLQFFNSSSNYTSYQIGVIGLSFIYLSGFPSDISISYNKNTHWKFIIYAAIIASLILCYIIFGSTKLLILIIIFIFLYPILFKIFIRERHDSI